ncbi:hypothetical protein R3P38DRAFT_2902699 [Favolaschia claudopus]|uniref:Secreted protein n=1 Tax=Favolaschia claudopus TaxID=2862362 RepID=A0AAW0CM58_9AGAR
MEPIEMCFGLCFRLLICLTMAGRGGGLEESTIRGLLSLVPGAFRYLSAPSAPLRSFLQVFDHAPYSSHRA